MERRRGGEAHGDTPGLAACRPTRPHGGFVDCGEDCLGVYQEGLTGIGQADAAGMADEEGRVDLALEGADLLGEGRLLDVELLRRTRDVALAGDGDEIAEMTQFHGYLSDMDMPFIIYLRTG